MEDRVKGPAVGLIATGVVSALVALTLIILPELVLQLMETAKRSQDDIQRVHEQMQGSPIMSVLRTVWILAWSALLIFAGIRMMKMRSWTLAVVASIAALVPCIACCCILGIPVGIWSLVVLFKPEVRSAFTA